jgi:hypothetical protein
LRQRPPRGRLAFRAFLIVCLVLVIALLGGVLIVLTGPTEFGIVRERVASIIRQNLGSAYDVAVGRAVVDIDPVLGLTVRVDDIDVRDGTKAVVAHVPSTRFAIDPYALLRFRVEVKQVELASPEIWLARGNAGSIYLGTADTPAPAAAAAAPASPSISPAEIDAADGGFPDILAALYIMDRRIEPQMEAAINAGFERFAVVNGTLTVSTNGQERRFPGTDLNVALDKATSALNVQLATSGYGGRWTATIDRDRDASSGSHVMSAVFSQLTIADLLPSLGEDDSLLGADIPL